MWIGSIIKEQKFNALLYLLGSRKFIPLKEFFSCPWKDTSCSLGSYNEPLGQITNIIGKKKIWIIPVLWYNLNIEIILKPTWTSRLFKVLSIDFCSLCLSFSYEVDYKAYSELPDSVSMTEQDLNHHASPQS